jgi:hypothetical protein
MRRSNSRRGMLALATIGMTASTSIAMAAPVTFDVPLTGAQEVPPVQSAGKGNAHLTYDSATRELSWTVTFSGLSSAATMAHIHGPAAQGKNAGVETWLTTKGAEVSSPISGKATLEQAEAQQLMAGETYINVHSKDHPGGEIRGQVMPPKK